MKLLKHEHRDAESLMPEDLKDNVIKILRSVNVALKPRSSRRLKQAVLDALHNDGWSNEVRIHSRHAVTLTAVKASTALCLQTGNMARFYADLLKLESQYIAGKIKAAIYIIPAKGAAVKMGSNLANFERMTSELSSLYYDVIKIPILVLGFYSYLIRTEEV